MHLCSVRMSDIKVSAGAPPEDETLFSFVHYPVKQPEASYFPRCLIGLAYAAFKGIGFVQLSVVTAHFFAVVAVIQRLSFSVSAYSSRVDGMCLLKAVFDSGILCDISVCQRYLPRVHLFIAFIYPPAHYPNERCVPETRFTLYILWQCYFPS